MKINIMILLGIITIGLCSCMVVVNDDDDRRDRNDDSDTVTIIFSKVPTVMAP